MTQRKGFVSIPIALVIVVVSMGLLWVSGLGAAILQIPVPCDIARYNPACLCADGYERIVIQAGSAGGFTCEKVDKFLYPENEDFDEQAVIAAKQELSEMFVDCDSIDCPGNGEIRAYWGQEITGNRRAMIECIDGSQGLRFWHITFDIEDGEVYMTQCGDYFEKPTGVNDASLEFKGTPFYHTLRFYFGTSCKYSGTATASIHYELPPCKRVTSWDDVRYGFPGDCRITDSTETSVDLRCDYECGGGGGGPVDIRYTSEQGRCLIWEQLTGVKVGHYLKECDTVCVDNTLYECSRTSEWLNIGQSCTTDKDYRFTV